MDAVDHKIWDWTQLKNNWLTASYIPRIFNIKADKESGVKEERTEWVFSKTAFDDIIMLPESNANID